MERTLQCNEFNRGHPMFFDQSEAELLKNNFDFVVFKSQSNSILKLTCMTREQTQQIQNFVDKYFEAAAFVFMIVCTVDETDFSSHKCYDFLTDRNISQPAKNS